MLLREDEIPLVFRLLPQDLPVAGMVFVKLSQERNQLPARFDFKFGEDVGDIPFNGCHRYPKFAGNFFVRIASLEQAHNILLARC